MIEARNLCKTFQDKKRGRVEAVRDISFQCQPGEIYALLGANGAGKTTTLRMLATILTPTSGDAIVDGASIVRDPEAVRHKVGFLSTATALYGRLSAREMIDYFGRLHGLQGRQLAQRRDTLMQMLEMQDFADRRCDKLSTGMKQKVSIARTLVHDPPVMIFDEPTLGLDVMAARSIVHFIRNCRDQGKTVIFSSHIMSEVERLNDRIGIIDKGQLLAEGTVEELRQQTGMHDLEDVFVKTVGGEGVEA
jgi:sodium transport system ATP-binding protein